MKCSFSPLGKLWSWGMLQLASFEYMSVQQSVMELWVVTAHLLCAQRSFPASLRTIEDELDDGKIDG